MNGDFSNIQRDLRKGFVTFAFSFFAYTLHWWTDTEGSLAAAEEAKDGCPVGAIEEA